MLNAFKQPLQQNEMKLTTFSCAAVVEDARGLVRVISCDIGN
jgi:hypothetical protein